MESFLIGLGVFLASFGPLLLIPTIWLFYRLVTRPLLRRRATSKPPPRKVDLAALICATLLVAAILTLSYLPGALEYENLCDEYAQPRLQETVTVEGFYRSRVYNYEARRLLEKGGFKYVEGPYPSQTERFRRYSNSPAGRFSEVEIFAPISQYGVRDELWETDSGVIVSVKTIYEMAGERELARAAQVTYTGGPLSILLGSYAIKSCPSILTEQGSKDFQTYYDLEKVVLRK
jgi:hypothetical protein